MTGYTYFFKLSSQRITAFSTSTSIILALADDMFYIEAGGLTTLVARTEATKQWYSSSIRKKGEAAYA
jgi:hypothetical protein